MSHLSILLDVAFAQVDELGLLLNQTEPDGRLTAAAGVLQGYVFGGPHILHTVAVRNDAANCTA